MYMIIKLNPNKPVDLEEESVLRQTDQKRHPLPNWSVIFSGKLAVDTIPEIGCGMTPYA